MKNLTMRLLTIITIALLLANSAIAKVDKNEIPPKGAKSLKEVATFLQSEGYENIIEIEFDDWVWEVEALSDHKFIQYSFDPRTLKLMKKEPRKETSPLPPANGKSILEILEIVEQKGYPGVFREIGFVEYKDVYIWEVEIYHKRTNRKIALDPTNGKLLFEKTE